VNGIEISVDRERSYGNVKQGLFPKISMILFHYKYTSLIIK